MSLLPVLPLVLLPGSMCDARLFAPQVASFSAGRTIVLPSLSLDDAVGAMAARVLAEAPPRFALLGLSLGGIVAMEVARRAPDRVERLALLDTNHLPEPPEVAETRAGYVTRARAGDLEGVMRDELKPRYLADGPRKAETLDLCMRMALDLGADVFERQSRAISARPDQSGTLPTLAMPALVLCGAEDRLCPPERHDAMAALMPNARRVTIEGAGHLPVLERPSETNAAIQDWLDRPS